MKNRILTLSAIIMCYAFNLYSQRSITQDEYKKIITTDAYYWGRSDFDLPLDTAKKQAREEFINQISEFAKSINQNDLMKRANYVKLEVEGNRTRIILYMPKDSLYIERVVETPKEPEPKPQIVEPKPVVTKPVVTAPEQKTVKIESGNEIIRTLSQIADFDSFCIQLNRYKRQGLLFDSQSGKAPDKLENCIMAIFENDVLEALYDSGSASRKDFLSGKTVQKPEDIYKNKQGIKVIFIKLN